MEKTKLLARAGAIIKKRIPIFGRAMRFRLPIWAFLVIVLAIAVVPQMLFQTDDPEPTVVSNHFLEKIVDNDELSTFESKYSGIATVHDEKRQKKVDFYVCYDAQIKAGIPHIQDIEFIYHEEKNHLEVKVPAVQITDVAVDMKSMDYFFEDKKENESGVSGRAYKACEEDIWGDTESHEAIIQLAKNNAENVLKALITPFMEQAYPDCVIEIVWGN